MCDLNTSSILKVQCSRKMAVSQLGSNAGFIVEKKSLYIVVCSHFSGYAAVILHHLQFNKANKMRQYICLEIDF